MNRRRATIALALGLVLSSCNTSQFAFKVDKTISFVAPKARKTVDLPATVRWRDEEPPANLRVAPNDPTAEYYGIFVDRAPLRPGATVLSLVDEGDSCRRTPGCPDAVFLARLKAYFTTRPELTLEFLADLRPSKRGGTKDPHEVTIVRMRGDRRLGEAAFTRTFFVDRP
ncbi:MAG: hypothetical protein QOF21_3253 [Actinomycetota bacterium]